MKRKSKEGRTVKTSATEIPPIAEIDLARLRATLKRPIDTSDIQEQIPGSTNARQLKAGLRSEPPKSAVRDAILAQLKRRNMTRYQLWKRAQGYCSTLPESAVYEFLRGERQIGLAYAEALMEAVELTVKQKRLRQFAS